MTVARGGESSIALQQLAWAAAVALAAMLVVVMPIAVHELVRRHRERSDQKWKAFYRAVDARRYKRPLVVSDRTCARGCCILPPGVTREQVDPKTLPPMHFIIVRDVQDGTLARGGFGVRDLVPREVAVIEQSAVIPTAREELRIAS